MPTLGSSGLRCLSLCIGVFLFFMGFDKTAWLADTRILVLELEEWHGFAPSLSRWYLETVAIPGAPIFSRLVPLGELLSGASLVLGIRIRLAATVALFMVINFHVAMGVIFSFDYLINGYGLPIIGSLLALSMNSNRLPFSFSR